jgi:hypothetical protein
MQRIEASKQAKMKEQAEAQVRKRHFLRHFYINCIILPRQARDKHRENSKNDRFLAGPQNARVVRSAHIAEGAPIEADDLPPTERLPQQQPPVPRVSTSRVIYSTDQTRMDSLTWPWRF